MTVEEELEMRILGILASRDYGKLYIHQMPPAIIAIIGEGSWSIIHRMTDKGLLSQTYTVPNQFEITSAGRSMFEMFLTQRREEQKLKRIFVWTLVAAIVAALAAILALIK